MSRSLTRILSVAAGALLVGGVTLAQVGGTGGLGGSSGNGTTNGTSNGTPNRPDATGTTSDRAAAGTMDNTGTARDRNARNNGQAAGSAASSSSGYGQGGTMGNDTSAGNDAPAYRSGDGSGLAARRDRN